MSKKLVLVVDTQYDFMMPDGKLYVNGAEKIIVPGISYLANLKYEDVHSVVFTMDTHFEETYPHTEESKQFPIHCVFGTSGWFNVFNPEYIDGEIPVYTVNKGVFDIWQEDYLTVEHFWSDASFEREEFFKDLKFANVDTVVVMGVASDFCVRWAVNGLLERGFKVEVIKELTQGIANDIEEVALHDFDGPVKVI